MEMIFVVFAFICSRTHAHTPASRTLSRPLFTMKGQLLLALFFIGLPLQAQDRREVDEPFEYELLTSDIFPWIDGGRGGPVGDEKGKMAQRLDDLLKESKKYVDVAIYGVNQQSWFLDRVQALKDARRRVRFVVDQAKGDEKEWFPENFIYPDTHLLPDYLGEDSIKIDVGPSGSARSSMMHNKFLVLDNQKVWLGSVNMSHTGIGAEYNANTVLVVNSRKIADIYVREFRQMFSKGLFSRKKVRSVRTPLQFNDGTEVSVYFSPQDNVKEAAVLPYIQQASRSLNIGMFYLTDKLVAEELARAAERGVKVRIICDALASHNAGGSKILKWLKARKIDVRVENWGGKMHMKTAVADGKNILMGSMNWSMAGHGVNDENTIVIKNNKNLGRALNRYFNKLWKTLDQSGSSADIYAESLGSLNSCSDGLDNDHDGKVDLDDNGCK